MLFKDASAIMDVNGEYSDIIKLGRFIRQGCHLAPFLFILATDDLFYILKTNELGPPLKGIKLPNEDELVLEHFTDDTTLFIILEEENFDNVFNRFIFFCKASGAKISQIKSSIIGWDVNPPPWALSKGWQWVGPHKIVRYLGIPFLVDPSLKEMWKWMYNKIERKHCKWKTHMLSLARRA